MINYNIVIYHIRLLENLRYICTVVTLIGRDTSVITQESDGFSKVSFHNKTFLTQSILYFI